jgi:hypothetical protein
MANVSKPRPRGITAIGWFYIGAGILSLLAALGSGQAAQIYEEKEVSPGLKLGLVPFMGGLSVASAMIAFAIAYGMLKGKRLLPKMYRLFIIAYGVLILILGSTVVARDPPYSSPMYAIVTGLVTLVIGILIDRYMQRPRVKEFFT